MKEYIVARDEDGELIIEQEITRCKNCKLYLGNGLCNRPGIRLEVNDNWFCADGIRKEGA